MLRGSTTCLLAQRFIRGVPYFHVGHVRFVVQQIDETVVWLFGLRFDRALRLGTRLSRAVLYGGVVLLCGRFCGGGSGGGNVQQREE